MRSQYPRGWGGRKPPGLGYRIDPAHPLAPNKLALGLAEGGSILYDRSPRSGQATRGSGVLWTAGPGGGPALLFNNGATNASRSCPLAPTFALGTTCWFAGRIRPASSSNNFGLILGESTNRGLFWHISDFKISLFYGAANHVNSTAMTLGRWYHFAVSCLAGAVTFYLDGVADGTAGSWPGMTANYVGNHSGSDAYAGAIDCLYAHDGAALTAAQAAWLAREPFAAWSAPLGPARPAAAAPAYRTWWAGHGSALGGGCL